MDTSKPMRKPEEILKAMETKSGIAPDAVLLTQLNAELTVSLSYRADEVSRRNLKVAQISLAVAIIALVISVIQAWK